MLWWLSAWLKSQDAQDVIEYVLITGLLVFLAVAGLNALGVQINTVWVALTSWLASWVGTNP
jgi:Flp pilus assembly pilin Flp